MWGLSLRNRGEGFSVLVPSGINIRPVGRMVEKYACTENAYLYSCEHEHDLLVWGGNRYVASKQEKLPMSLI